MNLCPAWTDERVEILRRYAAAGLTGSQIGDNMGISRSAAIGKARRAGIHITNYEEKRKLGVMPPARKRPQPTADPGLHFACTIMGLNGETCRWPMGEPARDMLYCGAPTGGGTAYCGWHHGIAHRREGGW